MIFLFSWGLGRSMNSIWELCSKLWEISNFCQVFKMWVLARSSDILGICGVQGRDYGRPSIKAIHDWARPISVIEIWIFIGLASYYRWFIEGFSSIVEKLTRLDVPLEWSDMCEASFLKLMQLLTLGLILALLIENEWFSMYCDTFDVVLDYVWIHKAII